MQNWELKPARDLDLPLHEQLKSVRREGGLINACTNIAWSGLVAAYLAIFHRLSVDGRQYLPKSGPFVLVANHCSHLDSLVLASAVRWRMKSRVFPIAAGDTFFSSPLMGILSTLLINALPMWRTKICSHGLADLRERLANDRCVYIVFPEGTRSRTGALARFKAGVGMLVAGTSVPVVPCRLHGTYQALPHDRRWPKPTKLRLKIGQPILFAEASNDREGWQTVATTLESAVIQLGPPSSSAEAPAR
ncbi:MAG: lysophospholipid acyltransferase family protein [Tepidisphaeraceae bacterium]|jgi:1-acyl-sn-glycerol-3-phosphate acyltransferase